MRISKPNLTPAQVLALGFASIILVGAIILTLPISSSKGKPTPFVDALFTSTSAVCVTGLIVVDTATFWSTFGQVITLILIQMGGLGYMTMATLMFLLVGKRITIRDRLIMQEGLNVFTLGGVVRFTKFILLITFIFESLGFLILWIRWAFEFTIGRAFFLALYHAISAFNNAGFSIFSKNLSGYVGDLTVNLVITSLIIIGGIGYLVVSDIYHYPKTRRLMLHSKLVLTVTFWLILSGTLVILILEYSNPGTLKDLPWGVKFLASYFQAVTPRTAGFNTIPTGQMTSATLLFTIVLMYIGASPGGTGGGIKTTTFGVILTVVKSIVRGKEEAELFGRRLSSDVVRKSISIAFLALLLVITVTTCLLIIERWDLLKVLFEVTSAFGTVGLSMGITPELSTLSKYLIIVTMYTGRVGPLTLGVAVLEDRLKARVKYPEDKVLIG